jgi:acetyl-CoA acetyltransferase
MDREIAIAAYHEAQSQRRSGRHVFDWMAEAATGTIEAAGLRKMDIDGLIVNMALSGGGSVFWSILSAESLGLTPRWMECVDVGGGSPLASIARAGAAIRAGFAKTVLCVMADATSTERGARNFGYRVEFEDPYGPAGPPGMFGMIVNRYRHQYGDPAEAMCKIAMTQRRHAQLNPQALLRAPMTREDYYNSKIIGDGIRLLDCVMHCDGALGVIVTSGVRAREITAKPVYLTGYAEIHNFDADNLLPDVTVTGFSIVAPEALAMAGLRHDDVDMIQAYDDFTIALVMTLEDAEFCRKGEGTAFVEGTDLSHQGTLPLNTGGGQISSGQPGLAAGMIQVVEAVRQLRGEGGDRQVPNARNALVTGIGFVNFLRNWNTSIAAVLEV